MASTTLYSNNNTNWNQARRQFVYQQTVEEVEELSEDQTESPEYNNNQMYNEFVYNNLPSVKREVSQPSNILKASSPKLFSPGNIRCIK